MGQQQVPIQQSFQYDEAELLWKRALVIREFVLIPEHPDTAGSLRRLGYLYREQGKHTLKIYEETLPPDNHYIAYILENYANLLRNMNRFDEAELLDERARAIKAKRSS